MAERDDLDALLDSVANREPGDWERAEARAAGPDRARVRTLREISGLAEFHRALQHQADPGAGAEGPARWGDLLLLERAGSGATGEVYRAWDPTLQREVALKLEREERPGGANAWLEGARALARIRDPRVVRVLGAAEHDGRAGIWMEFLRGPTLEAELARRGALPAVEVARLGAVLGRALEAAHAAGVVHGDVKPANVILEPGGRVVLADFGLGRRATSAHGPAPLHGTPLVMSPAQLSGAAATAADDLYALGVTLRWALAGAPPFHARTLVDLRAEVARGPARRLADERPLAPTALTAAIERAMAPDPGARFPTAAALAAAFEAASDTDRPARPRSVNWVVTALLLGIALEIAFWAVMWGRRHEPKVAPQGQPAPAVPAASVPYEVSASFLRRGRSGDEALEAGDRVAPGDRISLRFRATRPVWVYVLDADERGETYLLFPQPLFDRGNPLPADSLMSLPGARAGRASAWTVTSRGGREHLLVVANPAPIPDLEKELGRLPAPEPGRPIRYARVTGGTVERLRGIGGVAEVPPQGPAPDPAALFDRIRALAGGEQVRGAWVRQVVLENPLR